MDDPRSEAQIVADMLHYWNGTFFRPEELVYEVKQIDRRYSGAAVRRELKRMATAGEAIVIREGRTERIGRADPLRPYRFYWGSEFEDDDPGVQRQPRPLDPHEDIISMDPWKE